MGTTPVYAFPFQGLNDAPHGPDLSEDLALAIEAKIQAMDAALTLAKHPNSKAVSVTGLTGTLALGTYQDMPSGSSFSFTKRDSASSIAIDMFPGAFSSAVNTAVRFGVRINGVDYDLVDITINEASEHHHAGGTRDIAVALAAGTYTIQGRWMRVTGTGTLTISGDRFSMRATEVLAA